jgi:hypothetical protein
METVYVIACIAVSVLIVARLRFLARYVGWRRIGHELRHAVKGGF